MKLNWSKSTKSPSKKPTLRSATFSQRVALLCLSGTSPQDPHSAYRLMPSSPTQRSPRTSSSTSRWPSRGADYSLRLESWRGLERCPSSTQMRTELSPWGWLRTTRTRRWPTSEARTRISWKLSQLRNSLWKHSKWFFRQ